MPSFSPHDPAPGLAIARRVREQGIRDPRILEAIARTPRDRFMPPSTRRLAEADRAVAIGCNQTISQPLIVAVMTLELALTGVERVLEIGTGSGYQTAILSALAGEVFTVERHSVLSLRARGILDGLGLTNIRFRLGDGTVGWLEEAPFDRILVTAGAPSLPASLFEQLAEGGLLVLPLGDESQQDLTVIHKRDGQPLQRTIMACRFVKLIGAEGWDSA